MCEKHIGQTENPAVKQRTGQIKKKNKTISEFSVIKLYENVLHKTRWKWLLFSEDFIPPFSVISV